MQLTAGLAAVHGARVIHRDIKPANLKVTSSGDLKILDFGLAKVLPSAASVDLSATTVPVEGVAGTLPYMAPEQLRGEPVDERCDIYSAGAVLYEMMTGKRAFPQEQVACLIDAVLNEEPVDPCALSPFIPRALARVVLRAMRKRPHDRFQRAEQLSRALQDLSCAAVSRPVRRFADWLATLLG